MQKNGKRKEGNEELSLIIKLKIKLIILILILSDKNLKYLTSIKLMISNRIDIKIKYNMIYPARNYDFYRCKIFQILIG